MLSAFVFCFCILFAIKSWRFWSQATCVPCECARSKVISCVRLLAQKNPLVLIGSNSAKYLQTVRNIEKQPCLCFFLLDTFYKHLKPCVLSWHHRCVYRSHPDTWPCVNVQCETTVSVFLGFTIQRTFVRRQYVPNLLRGMCSTEL